MKWKGRQSSSNVERRSGGGGGMPLKVGGPGLIILMIIIFLMGGNPLQVLGTMPVETHESMGDRNTQELEEFVSVVLKDTEDVWHEIFKEHPGIESDYIEPSMVLYHGQVQSGCGLASSGMGPFYCPADQKIYMDVSFYDDLVHRFGADGGDYAMAYVLAHEVGHHVQNQLGILNQVHKLQGQIPEKEYNRYSVALELQADYFAGVFTKYIQEKGYLEAGDIEEAMSAAHAVGDDTIQKGQVGYANPDTFTHGTSEQRKEWFMRGFQYGDIEHGNTFNEIK
ncbi:MAG: neutral zinc metallopeptidase [Tissierellia bacterium]|nr:neutral zinc metallopeptidase [Tissierellia bacterium]